MVDSCIFCRIASSTIPSHRIYEDAKVFAFLDKYPLAKGHILIIPKKHVANIDDLSEEDAQAIFAVLFKLTKAVHKGLKTDSTTIGVNNGPHSGQEISHLHLHIVPRFAGDGGGPIHAVMPIRPKVSENEMNEIAEKIRGNLSA
ncbi:MAG: HIT family protein [Thaumarchaeota archaeon]|nr:HIT family protein [Nitrososphaerota archaeon]